MESGWPQATEPASGSVFAAAPRQYALKGKCVKRKSLGFVVLLFWVGSALAGTLELRNGDRIAGEFIRADEDSVYWASEKFGNLKVNKVDVTDISTTMPLKVHGVRTPCLIEGMDDEHLVYICGGDVEPRRVPLVSLAVIAPYRNFIQGAYTYKGRLSLSGVYARGNEVRDDWKLASNVEFRSHDWRHIARLEYASYSVQKRPSDVKWGGRYSLDWFFRERWFLNNEVRYGVDELRNVERFYNFGTGAGFQFWENTQTALAMTGGIALVSESYRVPDDPPADFERKEERTAWRLGSDFRYRLPMNVALFHKNELVVATESGGDWQLTSATGMNTMLAERLYSEVKVSYDVDNRPQQNTRREDTRLQVGLNYEW